MTKRQRHDVAEKIALQLFTNGQGERAQHLVLTVDTPQKLNLGGWGFKPVVDIIERLLPSEEPQ